MHLLTLEVIERAVRQTVAAREAARAALARQAEGAREAARAELEFARLLAELAKVLDAYPPASAATGDGTPGIKAGSTVAFLSRNGDGPTAVLVDLVGHSPEVSPTP